MATRSSNLPKYARAAFLGVSLIVAGIVSPVEAQTCIATTPVGSGDDIGSDVVIQPDGRIVVGGYYDTGGANLNDFIALRYNADLRLDSSFDGDGIATHSIWGNDDGYSIALQSDDKVVIGGTSNRGGAMGCCDQFTAVRLNPDGSADTAGFGAATGHVTSSIAGSWDLGRDLVVQPDGKILVVGIVDVGGNWKVGLIRYNTDGSLDPTFNPGGAYGNAPNVQSKIVYAVGAADDYANTVALQPDGKILVGGASHNGTNFDWLLMRLEPDGNLDATFGSGGVVTTDLRSFGDWLSAILLRPDGKIVAASKSNNGTDNDFAVARYNPDGTLDTTFGTNGMTFTPIGPGEDEGEAAALQSDGKIVLAGYIWNGMDNDFAVVRYTESGSLDPTFGTGGIVTTAIGSGDDRARGVTLQPDGKIVVTGDSHNGSDFDVATVRYLPDGTLDQSCSRYRSMGTSAANLNTGARTVEISGTTATFSGPMPDDIGVGDVLQYQVTGTFYLAVIHGRTSSTVYTVFATNGTTPQAATAGTAVGVYRAYTSMANWVIMDENNSLDNTVEDFDTSTNLVSAGTTLSIACYADGPAGYSNVTGWTTGPDNYIRIFTPSLPTEVGVSQRHSGVWDPNKFRIENTQDSITLRDNYVRLDGLQMFSTDGNVADYAAVEITGSVGASEYHVSNSIIRGSNGTADIRIGINLFLAGSGVLKAWNNLIYDWLGGSAGGFVDGILPDDTDFTFYLYNNTIVDNEVGIEIQGGTVIAKNNLVYGSLYDHYIGAFNAASTNNLSGPAADLSMPATNARNGVTVTFANAGADDFHLAPGDAGAQSWGADLSADADIAFDDDIDAGTRIPLWDIGADQEGAATGVLALEDHTLGQIGDRFTTTTPLTDTLFRFRMTRAGAVNVDTLHLNFSTTGGVANADVTNAGLYIDVNNDGLIDVGDTPIQTGVTPVGGVITFTTNFQPSTTGTNYVVRATVDNLVSADTATFTLDPADIDLVEVGAFDSGATTNAVHIQDASPGLTLADHLAGQVGDRFTTTASVTDVLYQFRLVRSGVFDVIDLRVNFTTANGVANGDVSAGEFWEDVNDNGVVDGGDVLVQGGVAGAGGALTFTTDFTPSTTGTNYLVRATVSNLAAGDFTTFSVTSADIDESAAVAENGTSSDALHVQDFASCSPAFNYLTSAIDVTPSVANSWQDVDVSGSVPAGATGVILLWQNPNGGGSDWDYGVRKKGSTDPFFPSAAKSAQQHWVMTGLDANRVFQVYQADIVDVKTYLVGYTMQGVTFLDNRVDKSLGTAASWVNVDISADTGADTAIGAIFLVNNISGSSRMFGLRKNGSTDNRVTDLRADTVTVGLIGVDGAEVAQMNIEDVNVDLYLVGYVTSGAVFFTNAVDKSTATTGAYVPVDITPDIGGDDANGAFVEITPSDNTRRSVALRPNGSTYDIYDAVSHGYAAVGIDGSNLFEQKIELDTMDLYLVGYSLGSCTAPTTNYRSIGTAADYTTGTVTATNGSSVVVGTGTSWQAANRGRGDRIAIDGADYTILSVDTDTQLTLTAPFAGTTGAGKSHTISRQFSTLQTWETCISGSGGCTFFPVASSSLVADDRREVGIAYDDSVFTAGVTINGSTTDADHCITLTADDGNRHYGLPDTGVVIDGGGTSAGTVLVQDDYTVVEWLDVHSTFGATDNGAFRVTDASNVSLQFLIARDSWNGMSVTGAGASSVTIRNSLVLNNNRYGIVGNTANLGDTLLIESNTVFGHTWYGVDDGMSTLAIRNTIAMNSGIADFSVGAALAQNNISQDASAPGLGSLLNRSYTTNPSPGAGDWVIFVNTSVGNENFHLVDAVENDAINNGVDLSASFTGDIDGGLRQTPWDVGADDVMATTAVDLISFVARPLDGEVEVTWETGSEIDNLGFHLYRSTSASGPYDRLTERPIPGLGNSPVGARYSFRDSGLQNGTTYFYQLEDIETTGATEMHGPVSATPEVGAIPPDPESTETGERAETRLTYGDPSANGLVVLRRGANFVDLQLRTEGFYAIPQDDGTVTLEIPGFQNIEEAGSPSVPVMRHWLDAVAGHQVDIVDVRDPMEAVATSWMLASETRELVADRSGTVRARRRRGATPRKPVGLFPAEGARLVTVGFQEEKKKALIELAPLRWHSDTGELFLSRNMVVRVSFQRVDASEIELPGGGGRRRTRRRAATRGLIAQLATVERGLYGVRFENVLSKGRALPSDALRLSRQGSSVAFYVQPDPERFGPGSTLYLLSDGAKANPYGNEAVFELSFSSADAPSVRMEPLTGSPNGSASTFYWKTETLEENHYYQAALLDAPDLWLWDLLLAPVVKSYPFEVTALATTAETARIEVYLQGTSDTEASPDHHVRIYLNGSFLAEASWNGKTHRRIAAELGPGLLRDGPNVLDIENVGDTDASYSTVMLDRFVVTYPRQLMAEAGVLEGTWSETGRASIAGLGPSTFVLEVGDGSPRWLESRTDSFYAVAGHSYFVTDRMAVRSPHVRKPSPPTLARASNRADYIVLGPRELVQAAAPLIAHREQQGLVARGVAIEDVFDEFGHGEARPEAIRDFLSYTYHGWKSPSPRYVLLLGDASYDFKDYGHLGVPNPVPPLMVKTSYLWTVSDPTLAAVNGDDILPDLAIGRLPVASADDVNRMVEKILAWESAGYGLDGPAVFVADNPDRAGNFVEDAKIAAQRLPSGLEQRRIFLNELGPAATRRSIIEAFDAGAGLMSYIGHGGIHLWADENVLDTSALTALTRQPRQPILLTMNCLNGYFHFPYFGSLSEELLEAEGRGVIAAFSPSGLSLNAPAQRLHLALLDELYSGRHIRLGDAVVAAQEKFLETGAFPELLSIYHLLGDPALTLR